MSKLKAARNEGIFMAEKIADQARISYHASDEIKIRGGLISTKGQELYPERLPIMTLICFSLCFGDARMYMPNGPSKNLRERFIITRNAIIFIRRAVQE